MSTGGKTIRLKDFYGNAYVIEVPKQKFPVDLTFKRSGSRRLKFRNPTHERIYRVVIKVTVKDQHGRNVYRFDPPLKTTMKYIQSDLVKARRYLQQAMKSKRHQNLPSVIAVKKNHALLNNSDFLAKLLYIYSNRGHGWNRVAMLRGSRDFKARTLTGYIGSFSGSGCGGGDD